MISEKIKTQKIINQLKFIYGDSIDEKIIRGKIKDNKRISTKVKKIYKKEKDDTKRDRSI